MENIAGYVYDHTTRYAQRWHQLEADQQGPYFVSMVHSPSRSEFLRFVRLHAENHACCDPLDGRVHSLKNVTRWIGIRELAVRFIGLGVILGVFELVRPRMRREEKNHEDVVNRLERDADVQFRLKVHQVSSISSIRCDRSPIRQKFRSFGGRHHWPLVSSQVHPELREICLFLRLVRARGPSRSDEARWLRTLALLGATGAAIGRWHRLSSTSCLSSSVRLLC